MAKSKGKKKVGRSDLKIIRKRKEQKLQELQQRNALVRGLEQRLEQERTLAERCAGAAEDYINMLIDEDPKGPEAEEFKKMREQQTPPKEPEKKQESGEGDKDGV